MYEVWLGCNDMAARYDIRQVNSERFDLYEDGSVLCYFTRSTFRESLEHVGRGSNWIGSILRLFLKKYPAPYPIRVMSPFERAVSIYGESGLAEYLRNKGFKV